MSEILIVNFGVSDMRPKLYSITWVFLFSGSGDTRAEPIAAPVARAEPIAAPVARAGAKTAPVARAEPRAAPVAAPVYRAAPVAVAKAFEKVAERRHLG